MDINNKAKSQKKSQFSEYINSNKNNFANSKVDNDTKEFTIDNFNNRSVLKEQFKNTQLKNISINFGFPNTRNSYDYQKNSFDLATKPIFEQKNYFYYDQNFQLFKNKSVSRYGDKKSKKGVNSLKKSNNNRLYSPQHKIITSIKKKKFLEENMPDDAFQKLKKHDKDNDIYELEVINQIVYNEDESEEKKKKSGKETSSSKSERESENEWGEIEQAIFEDIKDKDNNLLNSVCIELEKENGDKHLKYVEILKDENDTPDPCLKIKYTVEDKICLGCKTPEKSKTYKTSKETSYNKKNLYNVNTGSTAQSTFKGYNKNLKKENASEVYLKESKSIQNVLSPNESNDKFFSGSTVPSTQRYLKYSKYSNEYNNLKKKNIEEIKQLNYNEEDESQNYKGKIIPIKNTNLSEIIKDSGTSTDRGEKYSNNKNIKNLKYAINSYDSKAHKNIFKQNEEQINKYIPKRDTSLNKETKKVKNILDSEEESITKKTKFIKYQVSSDESDTKKDKSNNLVKNVETKNIKIIQEEEKVERKKIYDKYKKKDKEIVQNEIQQQNDISNDSDLQRINKRIFIRHNKEEPGKDNLTNKTELGYGFRKFDINKATKEKLKIDKKYETNTDKINSGRTRFIQIEKKNGEEIRGKSDDKYKNYDIKKDKEKKELEVKRMKEIKEKERIEQEKQKEKIRIENEKRIKIEKERKEKFENERKEKERLEKIEREKQERERLQRIEREKIEREKQEKERKEKLEKERKEKEKIEKERQQKIEKERIEKERQQKIERERLQKLELERKQKLEGKRKINKIGKRETRKRKIGENGKGKAAKIRKRKTGKRKINKNGKRKTRKRKITKA